MPYGFILDCTGKIIGGTLGILAIAAWGGLLGFFGLAFGLAFGHLHDRRNGCYHQRSGINATEFRMGAFLSVSFSVMAYICNLDRAGSDKKSRIVMETAMRYMAMGEKQRNIVQRIYNVGSNNMRTQQQFNQVLSEFFKYADAHPSYYRYFLELQVLVACADGSLSDSARNALFEICFTFNILTADCLRMVERAMERLKDEKNDENKEFTVTQACEVLGVDEEADMYLIKSSCCILKDGYSPRLLGKAGVPKGMLVFAEKRLAEIEKAETVVRNAGLLGRA
ncbi:MAG: co-chaperone DjlA [Candidatus Eutrophobiaceae bacterium]